MAEKATISAVCWIPRGAAKQNPESYELTEEDKEGLQEIAQQHSDRVVGGSDEEMEEGGASSSSAAATTTSGKKKSGKKSKAADDFEARFNMDSYDDEDEFEGHQFFSALEADRPKGKDPNIINDEDSEDGDAVEIRPDDLLLLAASAEQEWSVLEVYLYDEKGGSFYVHHDVPVGSYPLCLEWVNQAQTHPEGGNLVAVGSFEHHIDIWDLDVLDALEPVASLGGASASGKKKVGKKKTKAAGSHGGPVLALSRNPHQRHVLASGSADETVKVWDLLQATTLQTYTHHSNKVQCVRWHPIEPAIMLTASYDKTVGLLDARQPNAVMRAVLPADAESAIWDRHHPTTCLVSSESGTVSCFDLRQLKAASGQGSAMWTMQAHRQATTGMADSKIPGLLVTCSLDGHAKVWNTNEVNADGAPTEVYNRDLKGGKLFCVQSNPDVPELFGFGGNQVVLWDVTDTDVIAKTFDVQSSEESDKGEA